MGCEVGGPGPARRTALSTSCATSVTRTGPTPALDAASPTLAPDDASPTPAPDDVGPRAADDAAATPSVSIVVQNGHAVAMVVAPVAMASSARFTLIRVPIVSFMKTRAPPPPQQNADSHERGISATSRPGIAASSSRGGE